MNASMQHRLFSSAVFAAFVAERLDEEARVEISEHLAHCQDCSRLVALERKRVAHAKNDEEPARRWPAMMSAAVVLAAALYLLRTSLVFQAPPRGLPQESSRLELEGVVEARLDPLPAAAAQPLSLAEELHSSGRAEMVAGRPDQALDLLARAVAADPSREIYQRDWATAYLVRGEKSGRAQDYALAYERLASLARARVDPDPQLLFNLALALEGLQNRIAAEEMWQRYLGTDPASAWAETARRHQSVLFSQRAKPLTDVTPAMAENHDWVCREPLLARHYAERTILPDWAQATLDGNVQRAQNALELLHETGVNLADCSHEPVFSRMAEQLRSQPASDGARLRTAASAILDLDRASRQRSNGHRAAAAYERAFGALRTAELPLAELAAGFAAFHYAYAGERERAKQVLALARCDEAMMPGWAAQLHWADARIHLGDGSPFQALELYRSASRLFEYTRDFRNVAAVDMLIAENLTSLGAEDEAWIARMRALSALGRNGDTAREQVALNEAAEAALGGGYAFVALAYQQAADTLVKPGEDPSLAAYGALWLGVIQERCARSADALESVRRSRALAKDVSQEDDRGRLAADIDFAEGVVREQSDPQQAMELWSAALDHSRAAGSHFRAAQLLLARGRTARRLGEIETARADFAAGVEELELQRRTVSDETLRTSYFGKKSTELFDEWIAVLLERGEVHAAYAAAERWRERTLLDAYERTVRATPADAARVQRGLENGEALLQFTVLPDRIVRWEVRRGGVRATAVPTRRDELDRHLAAIFATADEGRATAAQQDALRWWHELLIPAALAGGSEHRLQIVPDPLLGGVPFGALIDPATGRYLVETFSFQVSPSATLFLACRERERALARNARTGHSLAFGDTRGALSLALPPLRAASNELRTAADALQATLLLDSAASKAAFLRAAPDADVVYLAGHAAAGVVRDQPALVLAAVDGEGGGLLSVAEIRECPFRGRLVVLAACGTARAGEEGVSSLARAFLVAGVPGVVGSVVTVNDAATRQLLAPLARQLMNGLPAAEALRSLQRNAIERDRSANPLSWAAFQLYGSASLPLAR